MSGNVTPNFRLQKPPFDSIPWDQAVNGNMDTIDAALGQCLPIANFMGTWKNATSYSVAQVVVDSADNTMWQATVAHISATAPTTFYQDRVAHPLNWTATTNTIGGSVAITVADAAPTSPKQGDLWFDTASAQLFVFYNDGTSIQWVVSINQPGNLADAPNDGNLYGRQSAAWAVIGGGIASVGRNYIHNSMFNVQQRGSGPWTTTAYTADRWQMLLVLDTFTTSLPQHSDTTRAQIGDESANAYLLGQAIGNAGATAFSAVQQKIEDVRRLAGKQVTVSFYASGNGTAKLGVSFDQLFGTGGSPSAVVTLNGQSVTPTAPWARYSLTFTLPSVAGKTLGTNNDHSTTLLFWMSSGANNNVRAGSIGVQTANFGIWGVQLEVGAGATPLEKPDPQQDLAKCQRFYQIIHAQTVVNNQLATGQVGTWAPFITTMRAIPTVTAGASSNSNIGTITLSSGVTGCGALGSTTVNGTSIIAMDILASADL